MSKNIFNWLFGSKTRDAGTPIGTPITLEQLIKQSNGYKDVFIDTALGLSAYNACVKIIAEDIASLPFPVYRREATGRVKAYDHPVYRLLQNPNEDMGSMTFMELLTRNLLNYGNAYAYIETTRGYPSALFPLHPENTTVKRQNGNLIYTTKVNGEAKDLMPFEVLHIFGPSKDGIKGSPIIEEAPNIFKNALSVDKTGRKFYENGAQLSGILKTARSVDTGSAEVLKKSWREAYCGIDNIGSVPILPMGVEFEKLTVEPESAQYIASKAAAAVEICRLFRISPTKIQDLSKANWNTLEQASIDHVRSCLRPWMVRWEQEINRKLFNSKERSIYYAEIEEDALTRGDLASQDASFSKGIQFGWYSKNDVRRMKNLSEVPGGDIYLTPVNMQAATADPNAQPQDPNAAPAIDPNTSQAQDPTQARSIPEVKVEAPAAKSRAFLDSSIQRMATKLSKALTREQGKGTKGKDLSNWLGNYLSEKASIFRDAIAPAMAETLGTDSLAVDDLLEGLAASLPQELEDAEKFDAVEEYKALLGDYIQEAIDKETK